MNNPIKTQSQQGMATLIVVVVVLIITTLMVFFAAKVGIFDQRMAGNEARYKEAFATAEAGLDLALQKFSDQVANNFTGAVSGAGSWTDIITNSQIANGTETDGTSAEAGEPSFGVTIADTGTSIGGATVYRFSSTGLSADGTGTATMSREVTMKKILGGSSPAVPIIVSGSVGSGGDFNIVANSNGGGDGVPVSIWTGKTGADVSFKSGSAATCYIQDFDTTASQPQCSNPGGGTGEKISSGQTDPALSAYNPAYPDVLPNDPDFPADLFQFLFGVARTDWQTVYDMANSKHQVAADCTGLDTHSGEKFRLWWITSTCQLKAHEEIGTKADPVILVIDDSLLDMQSSTARIYGLVFLFDNPGPPTNITKPSATFQGSSTIFGSLVSDVGGTAMNGSYSIVYDQTLISNLTTNDDSANFSIAYIPGSWRDF